MIDKYSKDIWNILICPYCTTSLKKLADRAMCEKCNVTYMCADSGALDLRLKRPKTYQLEFTVNAPLLCKSEFNFKLLSSNAEPEIDWSHYRLPRHFTPEIASYFPKAKYTNSIALDLGCGDAVHRGICEFAGFEYIGMDYDSPEAEVLGDAHALPFKENTFDLILMLGVLEHVRFPFVAVREAYRVLKSQGRIIGTVAFMEPFHGDSFYHHTHLGVFNVLQYAGFDIKFVAPRSEKWSVFDSLARMALFPRMPKMFAKSLVLPLKVIHKLWYGMGRIMRRNINEDLRILQTTGALVFLAEKK